MEPDRLYYFSGSANKYPGKGVNERVLNPNKYIELSRIPNWRKMLSNFWVAPFEINGVRWNTVEHMYQGYKINTANPQLAFLFSLNSGSPISKGDGDMARKNRKIAILTPEQSRQWENMKDDVLYAALYAKFSQNPNLKRLLFLTQDAELWHGAPRIPKSRQYLLEKVRAQLFAEENKVTTLSFEDAVSKLRNGDIIRFSIDLIFQPLAGINTPNVMITLIGKDNSIYIARARYDQATNQILPPI